jgi:RimJ/RimL family protein N-acetyltransferase
MVAWLAEVDPRVEEVQTFNDPDNEPMLRVNRELGYRPSELWDDWTMAVRPPPP